MSTLKTFASDNYAGVVPEVMEALARVNQAHARSYGADDITAKTTELFRQVFDADVDVYFVFNGTGANVLSISSATQSYNAILCADTSHIYNDESSAPETFTGCRFFPLTANANGKLDIPAINQRIVRKADVHYAQASLLSLTQSTEYGTVYTIDELKEINEFAHRHDLITHIDGSRFFNAAASLGCSLKDMSTNVGLDILSLGGTKSGMMFGEAVVVFNKKLSEHMGYRHKQVMQLASKTRFIAAQFQCMLQDELWRKYASQSNGMAQKLKAVLEKYPQVQFTKPVEANAIFATIPPSWNEPLMAATPFYVWQEHTNEVRLMCSFDTTEADIQNFDAALQRVATA